MKATLLRAALVGGLALSAAPLAAPAQASCADPIFEVCRTVCRVGYDVSAIRTLCTIT